MLFKAAEEITVWQKSIDLVKSVYNLISNNKQLLKDFGLRDQIQRSSISIPSNIAEGFERGSRQEFIRFLYISKGSCAELRTQLYIASELKFISINDFKTLDMKARNISGMLMNLIKSLRH